MVSSSFSLKISGKKKFENSSFAKKKQFLRTLMALIRIRFRKKIKWIVSTGHHKFTLKKMLNRSQNYWGHKWEVNCDSFLNLKICFS